MRVHRAAHLLVEAVHHPPQRLLVEPLAERREPDEVGEQDRQRLADLLAAGVRQRRCRTRCRTSRRPDWPARRRRRSRRRSSQRPRHGGWGMDSGPPAGIRLSMTRWLRSARFRRLLRSCGADDIKETSTGRRGGKTMKAAALGYGRGDMEFEGIRAAVAHGCSSVDERRVQMEMDFSTSRARAARRWRPRARPRDSTIAL